MVELDRDAPDRRNSDLCDSKTQKNTDMSEVGGSNGSIRLISDNLKQNNRRGLVVTKRYSMVKIPCYSDR